jgi:peptidase M28-like protein
MDWKLSDFPVRSLASRFEQEADAAGVKADVAELARGPRGSRHHPQALARAQEYVSARLTDVGWRVVAVPFERRWMVGVSDTGGDASILRRVRLFRRLTGLNLLAELPGSSVRRRVLIVAHLDSVACSPGADDNASGVAALIECARLLAGLDDPPAVALAVVDLEEVGKAGSGALARDSAYTADLEAVICLESVGTFTTAPGSQRLGGLGLLFRDVARRVRANRSRGDFVLALCRTSTLPLARALAEAGGVLESPLPILVARDPRPDGRRGVLATCLFPPMAHLDRSDHAPFWNRGVPALMVTTTAPFRNRHYHQPGDQVEQIDHERLTAVAVAVAATAATWPASTRT